MDLFSFIHEAIFEEKDKSVAEEKKRLLSEESLIR